MADTNWMQGNDLKGNQETLLAGSLAL
jgi:hypothetical protein